jgi:competence ComEA-like helix-hairpin-helix protein
VKAIHDFHIMEWKKILREWFHFTKKERLGIYIMGILISLIIILPSFFSRDADPIEPLNITLVQLDSMDKLLVHRKNYYNNNSKSSYSRANKSETSIVSKPYRNKQLLVIDINTADSVALEKLPGIGEKLSARMIKYRERLGGFIHINQLKEVYGMSDSNFMRCSSLVSIETNFIPIKIKLNSATYQEMRRHPYIDHLFAKSILAYIKSHQKISNLDELLSIGSLEQERVIKVSPYLDFEN